MAKTLDRFRLLLIAVASWMNQQQQQALDCLRGSELRAAPTWSHMVSGPEAAVVNAKVLEFLKN